MDLKKYITPAVIVMVIIALVSVIYNTMAADIDTLKRDKVDNQTIQMYIIKESEKDKMLRQETEQLRRQNEIKQRELELRQRELELKQRELETRISR